ncbi:MAG: hypothetical protein K0S71_908 [Clostridia bacterium]|nr:hypothetical protein [Clostridia bacterium]
MVVNFEELKERCRDLKADRAAVIDVSKIKFRQELRDMCKSNVCGKYGTNWACPPAIGEIEEGRNKINEFTKALVIQTIYQLEDSFDFEGMMEAKKVHKEIFEEIAHSIKREYSDIDIMFLSAGGCEYCEKCTYLENKPCRFPDKLIPPIEGYGIDVTDLANVSGIPYNNGPHTVSYMSAVLFR